EAELSEHRLLADVDELRGVVLSELDSAELELIILEESVIAVQRADSGRLAWEEDDPFIAAFEFDWEADGARDVLADLLDRICVRGGPQPDGIDDAMDNLVAMRFRDFHRANKDVPRECVDCFMTFDAAEAGVLVSLVAETVSEKAKASPFECIYLSLTIQIARSISFCPFLISDFDPELLWQCP